MVARACYIFGCAVGWSRNWIKMHLVLRWLIVQIWWRDRRIDLAKRRLRHVFGPSCCWYPLDDPIHVRESDR